MKTVGNYIIMDDGTEYYAYGGIIGLGADNHSIRYGYDGELVPEEPFADGYMPPAHQIELCDYMIDLWLKRRECAQKQ